MQIFKEVTPLQKWLRSQIKQGKTIGFVPTMGALHAGHLALMQQAREENDICVCSIFVNPTQFNQASDLQTYPRTIEKDIEKLYRTKVDVLFLPAVEEVYPKNLDTSLDLDASHLTNEMEGKFRPGHFEGVMQVVKRLLDIVEPHRLYMGQKDYQQFTIIQYMIDALQIPTELVVCPIYREDDGLAMSSRNMRLRPEMLHKANILNQTLSEMKRLVQVLDLKALEKWAIDQIEAAGLRPEYVMIADGKSLKSIDHYEDAAILVACLAAWADDVRLIDNMILKGSLQRNELFVSEKH